MRRPIENNTREGDIIYEPFCGSGTTIIAATQTNRVCYAVELDPVYVDIAVRRWQAFTGHKALLSGRGLSFEEMDAERKHHGKKRTKASPDKPARADGKPAAPARKRARAEATVG
jgi:adenine specific DNA methylase Mod